MKIKNLLIHTLYVCLLSIYAVDIQGQSRNAAFQGGYLFAHMRHEDYGRMYYYISKDAQTWIKLNNNQRINAEYRGHPDIIKGHDGRYYMIGVSEETQKPLLWTSSDLVKWNIEKELPVSPFVLTDNYYTERNWFGAPKLYYDEDSKQYIVTWHAAKNGTKGNNEWRSMRTYYVLTKDFISFSSPKRLFNFPGKTDAEMATIDVIIRKIETSYYAIIKDERWPEDGIPTGKSIRIAKSSHLTGPYSLINPKHPVTTPNTYYEAPILMPQPDNKGWMIFSERYPHEYVRFDARHIESEKWKIHDCKIPDSRHGAMVRLSEEEYNRILSAFSHK